MENWIRNIIIVLYFILRLCLVSIITGVLIMLLWNWLMPTIIVSPYIAFPPINFWQAFGIAILCGLLFRQPNYTNE